VHRERSEAVKPPRKVVAEMIDGALGWTNGWAIPPERYEKICEELAQEIVDYLKPQDRERSEG